MLKTFSLGGIHPPENKISAAQPIEVLPPPKQAFIPLNQNLGAPGTPQVAKGDVLKVGQPVAKGEAFISSNVHSPVSGKVLKIDNMIDPSGYRRPALVVNVEGDEWLDTIDRSAELVREVKLSRKEIIDKIHEMGIVGLGGATFPSHVKLMVPEGKKAEVLIINGVECEPYLTSDHRLMLEKGEEILVGTTILMKGLGVERAIIGIENNKPDAIENMRRLAGSFEGVEVCPLKVKYPQGGEKQLIKATINREVPSGKLPIEVGAVVNNVGTAFAVYEAVQKNKPLIERVVTITGKSVSKPGNFMVRIGTPIKDLIEKAGGLPDDTGKIIGGGPMMGKALLSVDTPVVKGSSGILIIPEKESGRVEMKACIRCGRCVSVCPMGLEPILLAQLAEAEMWEEAEKERVMDCIECGSCHYICPAGRPLLDYIRLGKNKVGQIIRNRGKN
ncbi:MAG: electron transport complex subunit RsxC [Bacteroidales bacterium]|nr:electron transport complex subunit RsxC [Bacteroidales bacterium]